MVLLIWFSVLDVTLYIFCYFVVLTFIFLLLVSVIVVSCVSKLYSLGVESL